MDNNSYNYDLEEKSKNIKNNNKIPNKVYTKKIYKEEEVKEILKDYIEVPKSKYATLRPGNTRVCYIRSEDNSFARGGYITVNPIEKNDGSEVYMQLRGNIRKSNKNNIVWMLGYSKIKKLYVFCGPEFEYAKCEIKKSEQKQRKELSELVDKISQHLRNLKREVRDIKREITLLKNNNNDDNISVTSGKTNLTDFSTLKIYNSDKD